MTQQQRLRIDTSNRLRQCALAAFLLTATTAATLHAQDVPATDRSASSDPRTQQVSAWDHGWAFEGGAGIGTPTGFVGIALERRVLSWFALSAGVGWTGRGLQPAAMGHLHLPNVPEVSLGVGVSGGGFAPVCILCEEAVPVFDFAVWDNNELSFEVRGKTGFLVRGFVGIAWLLNPNSYECSACRTERSDLVPNYVPYFGLAIGRSFG